VKIRHIYILIISTLFIQIGVAQDAHFSQYYNTPLAISPAFTGDFNAKGRFILNYKNQWSSVAENPFNTLLLSADGKFKKGKLNAGLTVLSDKSGIAHITSTEIAISVSTRIQLNKTNFLRYGIQSSWSQHSFNFTNLTWNSQYDGTIINPQVTSGEPNYSNFSYIDFSNGLQWKHVSENKTELNFGISAFHITKPHYGFSTASFYLPVRWCYTSNISIPISGNNTLFPSILFMKQAKLSQTNLGLYLQQKLGLMSKYTGANKPTYLCYGVYYRVNDAIIPFLKYDYNSQFAICMSYDFTVSKFHTVTNAFGSLEFTLLCFLK
jgi:type IX secretion system PorP/SprF family membrane protein